MPGSYRFFHNGFKSSLTLNPSTQVGYVLIPKNILGDFIFTIVAPVLDGYLARSLAKEYNNRLD